MASGLNSFDATSGNAFIHSGYNARGHTLLMPPDKPVLGLMWFDNKLWAIGLFTTIGGISAKRVAYRSGTSWHELGGGCTVHNNWGTWPWAIANDGSNIYIGAPFVKAGELENVNGIARWDGSNWHTLGSGVNNKIYSIISVSGYLYVAGAFTQAGEINCNYIACWNGSSWSSVGGGANGIIYSLLYDGGYIYAAGTFTTIGGVSARLIARWNGSAWQSFGLDTSYFIVPTTICRTQDGLYTSGGISVQGGGIKFYALRWDESQSKWVHGLSSVDPLWRMIPNPSINKAYALAPSFGASYGYVYHWTPPGFPSHPESLLLSPGVDGVLDGPVAAIASDGENLYIGGDYHKFSFWKPTPIYDVKYIGQWDGTQLVQI